MKPIKAIVLTYDKYRSFTDHMIQCYQDLWPNNPFYFQIPFQELPPTQKADRVNYHKCPSDIKGTVLTLLAGMDDEEMIYWCIDDKYPIQLDIKRIEMIHKWLFTDGFEQEISGLLFCRCRGMLRKDNLLENQIADGHGNEYLERKNYEQIWIHQYLKVKVLRHLFQSFPDKIPAAKLMDDLKSKVIKPKAHRLYVSRSNLAVFGESTSRGVLTKNCFDSMKSKNIALPDWAVKITDDDIIMGYKEDGPVKVFLKKIIKKFL